MARRAASILDGLLDVDALAKRRAQLFADVETLDALLKLLTDVNGSARRGRKAVGRRGGRRVGRPPAKGTIGAKILRALGNGQKDNPALMKAVKVSRPQLSVNLNNLKKRGYVCNVSRGTWAAA